MSTRHYQKSTRLFFISISIVLIGIFFVPVVDAGEFYALVTTDTPQDRDDELHRIAEEKGTYFKRQVLWPSDSTFAEVCEQYGMKAKYVIDWEGRSHSTSSWAGDGSRMVYCE